MGNLHSAQLPLLAQYKNEGYSHSRQSQLNIMHFCYKFLRILQNIVGWYRIVMKNYHGYVKFSVHNADIRNLAIVVLL